MNDSTWNDISKKKPSKGDVGCGFICTIQPIGGKPYVAEMCWLGGRKRHRQWQGDWSGVVTHWMPFPDPPRTAK